MATTVSCPNPLYRPMPDAILDRSTGLWRQYINNPQFGNMGINVFGLTTKDMNQAMIERPHDLVFLYRIANGYTDGETIFVVHPTNLNGLAKLEPLCPLADFLPDWDFSTQPIYFFWDAKAQDLLVKTLGFHIVSDLLVDPTEEISLATHCLQMSAARCDQRDGLAILWGVVQAQLPMVGLEKFRLADVTFSDSTRQKMQSILCRLKSDTPLVSLEPATLRQLFEICRANFQVLLARAIEAHLANAPG